jgi:hypothetical protein
MKIPSQKVLVDKFLNYEKVKERLSKYKHIGSQFSFEQLKKNSDEGPYFCHYLAWRLGTWVDEDWLSFFDELLANGISMNNWSTKKSQIINPEFDEFWSFIWELQVAHYFKRILNLNVEWNKSGPDITVNTNLGPFYIECYVYKKSFGLINFIEELCKQIDIHLKVEHYFWLRTNLPKNSDREPFFDDLFQRFLNTEDILEKLKAAQENYPVIIYKQNDIVIYAEGDDPTKYDPAILDYQTGDPEKYLNVAIKESIENKTKNDRNNLSEYRPNLLAINFLLSPDFQTALFIRNIKKGMMSSLEFNGAEAILLAACGINEKESLKIAHFSFSNIEHPILKSKEMEKILGNMKLGD